MPTGAAHTANDHHRLPAGDYAENVKEPHGRLLLIDHDPADARVVREALADATDYPFIVEWVTRLSDGLERLSRKGIGVILIDLHLPDSQGLAGVEQVLRAAPHVPV